MHVTGTITNADTQKPIAGAVIDIFATSDMSGTPIESQQADDNGKFDFSSSYLDSPGAVFSIAPFGYHQTTGQAQLLSGMVGVYPLETTKIISSVPWWAWVLVAIVVLGVIHFKYKKLF